MRASDSSSPECDSARREEVADPFGRGGDARDVTLTGTVFDPDGKIVPSAVVALLRIGFDGPDKELKTHVETGRYGAFVLPALGPMLGRDLALVARRAGWLRRYHRRAFTC